MSQNLETLLAANTQMTWKPELFDLSQEADRVAAQSLFDAGAVKVVRDDYVEQLREHFAYCNPSLVFSPEMGPKFDAHLAAASAAGLSRHGRWAFFPWRGALVHILEDSAFQAVRTSRNRNLITADEQKKFADVVVGIAGLSVGNSVALSLALSGGANHVRLADFDLLALSNVNRVRSSVIEFGCNKAEMTARQIFELNPYATVEIFADGLTESNVDAFLGGERKLDIVIDEIDNLAMKCLLRDRARAAGLPLVMATDNGDNGIIDVERYDLDPALPFFHGRMGEVTYDSVKNLDKMSAGRLIVKFVGPETATPRTLASMLQIGKTIVSWPQLGGAATLNGPAVAYCVRAIANGQPIVSDRALIDLDEKLVPGHTAPEAIAARNAGAAEFAKMFGV